MAIESALLEIVPTVTGVEPTGCQPAVPLVDDGNYPEDGKYSGKYTSIESEAADPEAL